MQIRRIVAAAGLSVVAMSGFAAVPANAVDLSTVDCTNVDAAVTTSATEAADAKKAFIEFKRTPQGELMRAARAEAKSEARQAGRKLGAIAKELRQADRQERKELAKDAREQRKVLAEAARVLRSDQAAKAAVIEEHKQLHATWKDSRGTLQAVLAYQEECAAQEPGEDAETGTDTAEGAETGTDTGEGADTGTDTGTDEGVGTQA